MNRYEKLCISLRYFLLGRSYYKAADALEFGMSVHTGTRKDGVTPEFQHQVEIAHYVRTLSPGLMYPEQTLTAVLLHDTTEDYDIPHQMIVDRWGRDVAHAVFLMDKKRNADFSAIGRDPISSIAKGSDRIHNLQSMVGVFTREKQLKYVEEVNEKFLPMLKEARRTFPQQELAYENIKHVLHTQLEFLNVINGE